MSRLEDLQQFAEIVNCLIRDTHAGQMFDLLSLRGGLWFPDREHVEFLYTPILIRCPQGAILDVSYVCLFGKLS